MQLFSPIKWQLKNMAFNPHRPVHSESFIKRKVNLNFHFHTSLWCLKWFCALSEFFFSSSRIGTGRVNWMIVLISKAKWISFIMRKAAVYSQVTDFACIIFIHLNFKFSLRLYFFFYIFLFWEFPSFWKFRRN